MGEVYRARDTKLDRDVALKVLPEAFTQDPDRLARFEREAKVLASLNHPNIGHIYGLEESEGIRALVLELVEGPTLADRIKQGPIPLDEALPIAKQIAEALEAAHEQGVIHRDLKPANVKVKDDGTVKVLDFGLAKALDPSPGGDPSQSPTLTAAATQMGVIMGTAAYMSPERARGKTVDKRADIWAFGCVLYEMLTGRRAFPGALASDTLAAVIRAEPEWNELQPNTHPAIRQLLERCLEKDTRNRWHDIADVRVDIENVQNAPADLDHIQPATRNVWWRLAIPWTVAAAMSVVVVALLMGGLEPSRAPGRISAHLQIVLPDDMHLPVDTEHLTLALSPDGSNLVFVGERDGIRRLYRRALSDPDAQIRVIEGTEGAASPFFSPRGDWVGYFDNNGLKRVASDSGVPLEIPGALGLTVSRGGTWQGNDIVYTRSRNGDLQRRSIAGQDAEAEDWVFVTDRGHFWPSTVPGTSGVLTSDRGSSRAEMGVSFVSSDTGDSVRLFEGGTSPRYSLTGHVLYVRSGSLYARRFDPRDATISGPEHRLLDGLIEDQSGAAQFSVAANDTLAFVAGDPAPAEYELVWVDRSGNIVKTILEDTRRFRDPRLSPDGDEIALTVLDGVNQEVGILDLLRGDLEYVVRLPGEDFGTVWDPTGTRRLAFSSQIDEDPESLGPEAAWIQDFNRGPEVLFRSPGVRSYNFPSSWAPDGRSLAMKGNRNGNPDSIFILDVETGQAKAFQDTAAVETSPMISPSGDWLAYISDTTEPGRYEVYVQPFPDGGRPIRISTTGGLEPLWSRDGRELFYWEGNRLMVVAIGTGPGLDPSLPTPLFETSFDRAQLGLGATAPNYDVSGDGRFVMVRRTNPLTPTMINVVLNWPEVFGIPVDDDSQVTPVN